MRWKPGRRSDQLEDRRSQGATGSRSTGAPVGLLVWLFKRFGIVGLLAGGAALYALGAFDSGGSQSATPLGADAEPYEAAKTSPEEERLVEFVSFVLDDAQSTWQRLLAGSAHRYELAKLVLFRGSTQSGCGEGQAAMGPFYCPADRKVYLDLNFFDELHRRFEAAGDFAQAYVIAHELGHHVQTLQGTSARVHRAPESKQTGAQGLSVRLELQADCYAGVWGHSTQKRDLLEAGDVEEALRAASVIGDDALQKRSTGVVRPESFTHGSSAQRIRWFRTGLAAGDPAACDTFGTTTL